MSEAPATEEEPIIERLQSQIERGHKLLQTQPGNLLTARFFFGQVRAILRRIYGTESPILTLVP
ncbi:MAG: hypothetical protein HGA87_06005, partial [Desulfobulbaceae bacterium]|nr:hypothetical protein [Desulfobulbaceae bacterium]